ncbi:MAG: serine/threonine-protein kinase [Polyangiaceae bacterium]
MTPGLLISGKYRLQRSLGAGTMGEVWAARNELTDRDFAIKFLRREFLQNEEAGNRFLLEARACGQIRHSAIVDVYDMGRAEDGSPYLVMELLEGEGFDERLTRQGVMRPADVCRWIALVARGLAEAHKRGLIHRDLKPGNIFFAMDKGGELNPKILDFGISKEITAKKQDFVRTSAGTVLGSPAYMSPEQARGESDVDERADLWALGVMMYEALYGALPFDAANYNALMLAIISEPHRSLAELRPDCPPALAALVDTLLQKGREGRIQSANDLADRLEHIYATLTTTPFSVPERLLSVPPTDTQTQQSWQQATNAPGRRRVSRSMIGGSVLALLGLAAAGSSLMRADPEPVAEIARVNVAASTLIERARSQYERASGAERTARAEAAAHAAEERADEVERKEELRKKNARKSSADDSSKKPKTVAKDPHGGVDGPGF